MLAGAFGVEVDEGTPISSKGEDDWMKPPSERYFITGQEDLQGFEYGLGYETKPAGSA